MIGLPDDFAKREAKYHPVVNQEERENPFNDKAQIALESGVGVEAHDGIVDNLALGFATGTIGTMVRRAGLNAEGSFKLSTQDRIDLKEAYGGFGVDDDLIDKACEGARSEDDVIRSLAVYSQNRYADKVSEGSLLSSLAYRTGNDLSNPVVLGSIAVGAFTGGVGTGLGVGLAKTAAGTAANIAVGAAAAGGVAGAAAKVHTDTTAVERDVAEEAVGAAVAAVALGGLGAGVVKFATKYDRGLMAKQPFAEIPDPTRFTKEDGTLSTGDRTFFQTLNDFRETYVDNKLPDVELKSKLKRLATDETLSPELREFAQKITGWESGVRVAGENKNFLVDVTFMERVKAYQVDDVRFLDSIRNKLSNVSKTHGRDKVNEYIYTKGTGGDTARFGDMNNDVVLNEAADIIMNTFAKRGELLGMNEIPGLKYLPMVVDSYKIHKVLKQFGDETVAIDTIAKNLYDGVMTSPAHLNNLKKLYWTRFPNKRPVKGEDLAFQRVSWNKGLKWKSDPEFSEVIESISKDYKNAEKLEELLKAGKDSRRVETSKGYFYIDVLPTEISKGRKGYKLEFRTPGDVEEDFFEWVRQEARNSAVGYVDQGFSKNSMAVLNNHLDTVHVNYNKHRMPWNHSYVDEKGFSTNSLRADIFDTSRSYMSTTTGDLASREVFGTDYQGVLEMLHNAVGTEFIKSGRDPKVLRKLTDTLVPFINRGYGRALSPADHSTADAISTILRNMSYFTYNSLMAILNFGEVAGALRAYSFRYMAHALPGVKQVFDKFSKGLSQSDRRYIQDYMTGREVTKLINPREIMRLNSERYKDVHPFFAKAAGITQVLADYSPGNLLMRATNDSLVDGVHACFSSELINLAHGVKTKGRGFLRAVDLKRAGVSEDELNHVLNSLKTVTSYDKNGKLVLDREGLLKLREEDMRFSNSFLRLFEYVSNETIQRRSLDDIFVWEVGKSNPFLSLLMQFKTFAVQSYNKRLVKMMNRLEDEGAVAQVTDYLIASALTGVTTLAQFELRTAGMSDEDKSRFYQRVLGVDSVADILGSDEAMKKLAFQAGFNRHPIVAGAAMLLNTAGFGTEAKTTAATRRGTEDESGFHVEKPSVGGLITDMVPAARLVDSGASLATGVINAAGSEEYSRNNRQAMRDIIKGMSGGLPNAPWVKNIFMDFSKEKLYY